MTGEQLYHRFVGSTTTDRARGYYAQNPAFIHDWERLAAELTATFEKARNLIYWEFATGADEVGDDVWSFLDEAIAGEGPSDGWRIAGQRLRITEEGLTVLSVTEILLADRGGDDEHRIGVAINELCGGGNPPAESPWAEITATATVVYPCRECGWAQTCGTPPGEDCHS